MELWVLLVDLVILITTAVITIILHRVLISTKQVNITRLFQKAALGVTVMLLFIIVTNSAMVVFTYSYLSDDYVIRTLFSIFLWIFNFIFQIGIAINSDAVYSSFKKYFFIK